MRSHGKKAYECGPDYGMYLGARVRAFCEAQNQLQRYEQYLEAQKIEKTLQSIGYTTLSMEFE